MMHGRDGNAGARGARDDVPRGDSHPTAGPTKERSCLGGWGGCRGTFIPEHDEWYCPVCRKIYLSRRKSNADEDRYVIAFARKDPHDP